MKWGLNAHPLLSSPWLLCPACPLLKFAQSQSQIRRAVVSTLSRYPRNHPRLHLCHLQLRFSISCFLLLWTQYQPFYGKGYIHCLLINLSWGLLFIMKTKSMMTTMPMMAMMTTMLKMAMMTRALPHVSRYPQVEAEVPLLQRALQLLTIFGAAGSRKLLNGGKYFHLYN